MARPRSLLLRRSLPCHFLLLPVVLIFVILTDTVIAYATSILLPSRAAVSVCGVFELQEGGSAPTLDTDTTRCKKMLMSSTTTRPSTTVSVTIDHGTSSNSPPKLRCFCISTSSLAEMHFAGGLDEDGRPVSWLKRRRSSSHFLCTWALPMHHYCYCVRGFFFGRCSRVPPILPSLTWRVRRCSSTGGRWQVAIKDKCCYVFYMQTLCIQRPASLKVGKGTRNTYFLLGSFLGNKHGSDKTSFDVRADLRLPSMLFLRFDVKRSRVKFLSPVKAIRYLRLKIINPHRHRPVRQSRGAPTVLSECNKEDPQMSLAWLYSPAPPLETSPVLVPSKVLATSLQTSKYPCF